MRKNFTTLLLFSCLFLVFLTKLSAQGKYWVFFTDKCRGTFNPAEFFDKKALERRQMLGLDPDIPEEWPVNEAYLAVVSCIVDSMSYASRWFNAVTVYATADQMRLVCGLSFVLRTEAHELSAVLCETNDPSIDETNNLPGFSPQIKNMQGELFAHSGITGKGIRIAVFDAGFPGVDTHPAFAHIRDDNRIIKTWDFTRNDEDVYRASRHGTAVLSCITGMYENNVYGIATGAEFLLARTEVRTEIYAEEEYWLAAVEWADQNGAHIINSSLGYTHKRYFRDQMDGKASLASRAATLAARKGILVINAAGNDGNTRKWKVIGAPADADSIISVGGIHPHSVLQTTFSSFGPTADGRLKPNVCAFGHVMAATPKAIGPTQGTSFAAPLVAGFAACAWELRQGYSNMQMLEEIQKSAHLFPYFDYSHGYGVPQASYFFDTKKPGQEPAFEIIEEAGFITIHIKPDAQNRNNTGYLFYHISDKNNRIINYYVLEETFVVAEINKTEFGDEMILRVHMNGITREHPFNKKTNTE